MSGDAVPRVLILAAAIALGAWLRFEGLNEPSYWLDEMLGDQLTQRAAEQPWWRWLIGLEREHGPLYYLTQLLLPGRVAAAIFGLATIPLVWLLAKRVHSGTAAAVCAVLLAVSPLHVYYSREARPYALLMMLTAALLVSSRWWFVAALVALVSTSAVAAPVVV
ncbi:MAG TPA: glycosyltransferase family 39 protein, partial [Thermoanaerobaculia bacterium]